MSRRLAGSLAIAAAAVLGGGAAAAQGQAEAASPQAGTRSYAQNYKDMVLAECIATAYQGEQKAARDAGSSASALRDWTQYDWDAHPYDEVTDLVRKALAQDYRNPLVESEVKGVRFDLLKCLDLYHSKALEAQVRKVVIHPKRTYRQDNPPAAAPK